MTDRYSIDAAKAAHLAFTSLVLALHKNGALQISAVVTELGNLIDSQNKLNPDRAPNNHERVYYDSLLSLKARISAGFPKSPD